MKLKRTLEIEKSCDRDGFLQKYMYNPDTGIFYRKIADNYNPVGSAVLTEMNGYIRVTLRRQGIFAHRLAFLFMTGEFPTGEVDHINHNRKDNRWCNLREVSSDENQRNVSRRSDNTSGVTGVNKTSNGRWIARINAGSRGKRKHLGIFDTLEEATAARLQAEKDFSYHVNHGKEKNEG